MKKREIARLRAAVEEVEALHGECSDFLAQGVRGLEELRAALDRSTEELRAARAAWEAAALDSPATAAS